eukprot:TRINITY_DN51845_c0_g1_i1.p1 TRINITY_DN51845_c0_g1~~TRINITY_DN51845_c0_g1_i1.p1  ORF type:complete len:371 (-),score=36.06 TRINITY_DN51845_c0_g1_i1:34-1146(-)
MAPKAKKWAVVRKRPGAAKSVPKTRKSRLQERASARHKSKVPTLVSRAISFAKRLKVSAAEVFVSFFAEAKWRCVGSPCMEQLARDSAMLAHHLYTLFGYDLIRNGPTFGGADFAPHVEAIKQVPAFIELIEFPERVLPFPRSVVSLILSFCSVPLAIARVAAEELPSIWQLSGPTGSLPGCFNTIKAELSELGMYGRATAALALPQVPAHVALHYQACVYACSATRHIETEIEEVLRGRRRTERMQELEQEREKAKAEYMRWHRAIQQRDARPTGKSFNRRVRIVSIQRESQTWSGVIWNGEDTEQENLNVRHAKPDVCVEFEEVLLQRFRIGMIVTGNYHGMSDGLWVLTDLGFVWPSFYNEKRYIVW